MSCRRCANELRHVDKFCDACGDVVAIFQKTAEAKKLLYMNCGSGLRGEKNYCTACGLKVRKKEEGGVFQRFRQALGSPRFQLALLVFTLAFIVGPALFVGLTSLRPGPPKDQFVYSAYVIPLLSKLAF